MLTEQDLASAKKSRQQRDIIVGIIDSLPEEQWMDAITKALPDADKLGIRETIMIHRGGDVISNGKRGFE